MTVFEIIKRRRSIGKMTEQRPTREPIQQILEAATHAPNHHLVQPWKFFVLAGTARNELGLIKYQYLMSAKTSWPFKRSRPLR
ncbi:MAG TPA: nitroreductase family protein [Ktedonobacteraceae bacterium]|nr:nitroreductase family protein [Ktedonobacteraceae bacterium]